MGGSVAAFGSWKLEVGSWKFYHYGVLKSGHEAIR